MLYRDLAEPAAGRRSPNGLLTRCRTENDRIIHPFALGQAADVAVPAHDCCFRSESNKTRSKIINISINTPDLSLLCCLRELESRHLSSMPRKLQERDLKKKNTSDKRRKVPECVSASMQSEFEEVRVGLYAAMSARPALRATSAPRETLMLNILLKMHDT